jgi:DNA-binding NarL/FixJ family response regulator
VESRIVDFPISGYNETEVIITGEQRSPASCFGLLKSRGRIHGSSPILMGLGWVNMITVLIADDHNIVRDVLCFLLERAGDITVVAAASDGQEAVLQAVLHRPDVVVMDVSMPGMNGIEAAKQINLQCPETKIVMLSMYDTLEHIRSSMMAGAFGYVLKDMATSDLISAIRSAYKGNRFFSKQISDVAKRYVQL